MSGAETSTRPQGKRRPVRFTSFAELSAEAARAVETGTPTTGNWTLGQILEHLAKGLNGTVDGFTFQSPWIVRMVARHILLHWFLKRGMAAGFKLKGPSAEALLPDQVAAAEALARLNTAIARLEQAQQLKPHPIFGQLTLEQARLLQLRHAELHMSFVALD